MTENSLATLPQFLIPKDAPTGLEGCDTSDLPIPRLSLMNSLSDFVHEKIAESGQFVNTVTKEIYPQGTEIVLISVKRGAMYSKKKKVICRSNNGEGSITGDICKDCPHNVYHNHGIWENNTPPECAPTIEFFLAVRNTLLNPVPDAMFMSFSKSSFSTAKDVLAKASNLAKTKNIPMFAMSYKIESFEKVNDDVHFYSPKLISAGWLKEDEFNAAMNLNRIMGEKSKEAAVDGDEDIDNI